MATKAINPLYRLGETDWYAAAVGDNPNQLTLVKLPNDDKYDLAGVDLAAVSVHPWNPDTYKGDFRTTPDYKLDHKATEYEKPDQKKEG